MLLGKDKPDPFEVYNDYNSNLVNLFRCMRDRPAELIRELGVPAPQFPGGIQRLEEIF